MLNVSYLPQFPTRYKDKMYINGRNVYEGYQRGWGLRYGDLVEKVGKDKLYAKSVSKVRNVCILSEAKLMNIFLILNFFLKNIDKGDIIEFGSYKGGTAMFMAYVVKELGMDITVHGLDTFEGMPATNTSLDLHNKNDFDSANFEQTMLIRDELGLDNLYFYKGMFQHTAETILNNCSKIALAHIDCDIYESVSYSYNIVNKYMVDGGYIVFDDVNEPSCIGATQAFEEYVYHRDKIFSEQVFPHLVIRKSK